MEVEPPVHQVVLGSQLLECVGWGCVLNSLVFFSVFRSLNYQIMEFKNGVFNAARDGNLRRLKVLEMALFVSVRRYLSNYLCCGSERLGNCTLQGRNETRFFGSFSPLFAIDAIHLDRKYSRRNTCSI